MATSIRAREAFEVLGVLESIVLWFCLAASRRAKSGLYSDNPPPSEGTWSFLYSANFTSLQSLA